MCLLKFLKPTNKKTNKKDNNKKHFQWLDGEKDDLTVDEAIEIEEMLEDD